jgi:hypothetical protein
MAEMRKLRSIFVGRLRESKSDQKHQESNLVWGPIGIGVSIVLTVVAAIRHDPRFLLWFAWVCFIFGSWRICKAIPFVALAKWVLILSVLGSGGILWAIARWLSPTIETPKNPDIHIMGVGIQPGLGDTLKYEVYLTNEGNLPGTLELSMVVDFLNGISNIPQNRREEETYFFGAAAYNLDDPSKQKMYLDVDANDTFAALADTHMLNSDFDKRMLDKEVVLVVGKGKLVGHPESKPVELCFYWLKDHYGHANKCEVHNTD